jgi:hypothetical protein
MANQDDIKFHSDRAMVELDYALKASSIVAANAHLGLSELHLQRMRSLTGGDASATLVHGH